MEERISAFTVEFMLKISFVLCASGNNLKPLYFPCPEESMHLGSMILMKLSPDIPPIRSSFRDATFSRKVISLCLFISVMMPGENLSVFQGR